MSQVRVQLAVELHSGAAAAGTGGFEDRSDRVVRQFREQQVQPRSNQRSALGRSDVPGNDDRILQLQDSGGPSRSGARNAAGASHRGAITALTGGSCARRQATSDET